jgi:hypothetical protein
MKSKKKTVREEVTTIAQSAQKIWDSVKGAVQAAAAPAMKTKPRSKKKVKAKKKATKRKAAKKR